MTMQSQHNLFSLALTPLWIDIINHRLEVDDCLQEVFDDNTLATALEINLAISRLKERVNAGVLRFRDMSDMEREILKNCLEGSTYYYNAQDAADNGDISHQKAAGIRRGMVALVQNLELAGFEFKGNKPWENY